MSMANNILERKRRITIKEKQLHRSMEDSHNGPAQSGLGSGRKLCSFLISKHAFLIHTIRRWLIETSLLKRMEHFQATR
jgi:hypothetical protein